VVSNETEETRFDPFGMIDVNPFDERQQNEESEQIDPMSSVLILEEMQVPGEETIGMIISFFIYFDTLFR
jgi:hypothetical protein